MFNHRGAQRKTRRRAEDIMTISDLTGRIISCSMKVHSGLGPGLLESAYEACLYYELVNSGLVVDKQKPMPLTYNEVRMDIGYRIDLLVEQSVIIEIKSADALNDVHLSQILTYMKLSGCNVGLLINFNVRHLKDGIKRVIL